MTLNDLIHELQSYANELGSDTPVRLAQQPGWAFEYSIDRVEATEGAVWIGEGTQLGYLPNAAAVALGWAEDEDEAVPA